MNVKFFLLVITAVILSGLILTGCKSANFEKAECQFEVPQGVEIQCGFLSVPEDRSRRDSPLIRLHFAVIQPYDPDPAPDPVLVLNGGPGNYTLDGIDFWLFAFRGTLRKRALILLDQRGVGYSQPSLDCPEVENQWIQDWTQNLDMKTTDHNVSRALQACHDRLTQEGIDLSAYTDDSIAADVEDLRRALGYSKWNLYGGAYGSRLALTVMHKYPQGIRSVILDSAAPPQVDLSASDSVNLERSLNLLFDRCAADDNCRMNYPQLKTTFYKLVDQLDTKPKYYVLQGPSSEPAYQVILNGDRLIWAVSHMFYGTGMLADLPHRISTLQDDLTFSFGGILYRLVYSDKFLSEGLYYSIQCKEKTPVNAPTSESANPDLRLQGALDVDHLNQDCLDWNTDQAASVDQEAVVSNLPTLILSGELDPDTPPEWGKLAAKTLSRSQFLEFPGFGHGVLGGGSDSGRCTIQIVTEFIEDPGQKVDSSCIHSLDLGYLNQ